MKILLSISPKIKKTLFFAHFREKSRFLTKKQIYNIITSYSLILYTCPVNKTPLSCGNTEQQKNLRFTSCSVLPR